MRKKAEVSQLKPETVAGRVKTAILQRINSKKAAKVWGTVSSPGRILPVGSLTRPQMVNWGWSKNRFPAELRLQASEITSPLPSYKQFCQAHWPAVS